MTMTTIEHEQMLRFRDALLATLNAAAKERSARDIGTPTRFGHERAWMVYERNLMRSLVNDRRAELGVAEPVSEDEVYAVEQSAAGHSDYAHKFTLRLAFLAYGQDWRP